MKLERKILRTKIDNYFYEKILDEKIPKLSEKNPISVTKLLAKKLQKAIFLDGISKNRDYSKDDISYAWRPAIEEHPNNGETRDVKSALVRSLRNTLEVTGEKDISLLKKCLEVLKERNYLIFRRLELHIYKFYPEEFKDEIEKIALEGFADRRFVHEYYSLLKKTFSNLQEPTRKDIVGLIEQGPDPKKFNGTEEQFKVYKKRWTVDKLEPIIEYLPDKKEEYEALLKEVGRSKLADFVVTHSVFREIIPHTELTDQMKADEVLSFIKTYQIEDENIPEDDGTAEKFREMVEQNPLEYSSKGTGLLSVHPIFTTRFFWGLTEATKKKNKIDWDNTLSFAETVIGKLESEKNERISENIIEHLADLLETNLLHDDNSIPFSKRGQVWNILKKMVLISNDDSSRVEGYPNKNLDLFATSINSAIGGSMHAVMQYTVWNYHGLKKLDKTPDRLEDDVKILLEQRLDPDIDKTISTHAVFGFHIHNLFALDKKWTTQNIQNIFKTGEFSILGDAAWESHLLQNAYSDVFHGLYSEYEKRVGLLKTEKPKDDTLRDPSKEFSQHIAKLYLLKIEDSDKIFELFLKNANDDLIGLCIEAMGRALDHHRKDGTVPKRDLKKLWERKDIQKYPEIGWFFVNSPLERSYNIRIYLECLDSTKGKISPIYKIPEELARYAEEFPLLTILCVEKIIGVYQNNWEIYPMRDGIKKIVKTIKQSEDEEALEKSKKVINLLGQMGYEEFRELL